MVDFWTAVGAVMTGMGAIATASLAYTTKKQIEDAQRVRLEGEFERDFTPVIKTSEDVWVIKQYRALNLSPLFIERCVYRLLKANDPTCNHEAISGEVTKLMNRSKVF